MADFRMRLYEKYITAFKSSDADVDQTRLTAYWKWCDYRYAPLLAKVKRDAPVLDLGCGTGLMMGYLNREGFTHVEGIDISEEQIAIAVAQGYNAQVADAFEFLEGQSNAYAAIIALDFFEHFTKDELIQMLQLVHGALKEEGWLLLQTPNGSGLFPHQVIYDDLTHLTILSPSSLQNILKLVGFDQISIYETGPVPKNLNGKIRCGLWRTLKLVANLVRVIETGKTQSIWTENMIGCCRKPSLPI